MITFTLIVLLLMPSGDIQTLNFGADFTREECVREARRADLQLSQTLSVAKIMSIRCRENMRI